ncbi:hypothetical protein MLD38_005658 [Melastoma candidum]|uniref:Uncharacterized protein n=1 Tax=Melastoma candidum TaxID=119954 RepID=A0ACB9RMB7_9MYRT|nr:hypothetical protein MLD38_005658 [Melastoma candidum]
MLSSWTAAPFARPPPPPPSFSTRGSPMALPPSVRIAVVGDVHDQWDLEADTKALQFLKPDLVLFTGDFGNENVDVVRNVAKLEFAKAAILGNHDSWHTQQFSSKRKDNVQLQLEFLGEEHVAYRRLDFPLLKLSVVGGRPFSWGGDQLFRKKLLSTRFGVDDMDQSSRRIRNAALGAPEDHLIIFLAHNGPTGLGSKNDDICGKDWVSEGSGDNGDPDLADALSELKNGTELQMPLVVFGHMHKWLAFGKGQRKMIVLGDDGMIYLNGAIVPRVRPLTCDPNNSQSTTDGRSPGDAPDLAGTARAFTVVEISDKRVVKIAETWVSVHGETTKLEEEQVLFTP